MTTKNAHQPAIIALKKEIDSLRFQLGWTQNKNPFRAIGIKTQIASLKSTIKKLKEIG
jgi:ribosomal protein L29